MEIKTVFFRGFGHRFPSVGCCIVLQTRRHPARQPRKHHREMTIFAWVVSIGGCTRRLSFQNTRHFDYWLARVFFEGIQPWYAPCKPRAPAFDQVINSAPVRMWGWCLWRLCSNDRNLLINQCSKIMSLTRFFACVFSQNVGLQRATSSQFFSSTLSSSSFSLRCPYGPLVFSKSSSTSLSFGFWVWRAPTALPETIRFSWFLGPNGWTTSLGTTCHCGHWEFLRDCPTSCVRHSCLCRRRSVEWFRLRGVSSFRPSWSMAFWGESPWIVESVNLINISLKIFNHYAINSKSPITWLKRWHQIFKLITNFIRIWSKF